MASITPRRSVRIAAKMATAREMAENKTIYGWYCEEIIALFDAIDILQEKNECQRVISLAYYQLFKYIYSDDVLDVIRIESPVLFRNILDKSEQMLEELDEVRARGLKMNKYDLLLEGLLVEKGGGGRREIKI